MSLFDLFLSIVFCLTIFFVIFFIATIVKNLEGKRRIQRLEDDQRYINNKRNGWDW